MVGHRPSISGLLNHMPLIPSWLIATVIGPWPWIKSPVGNANDDFAVKPLLFPAYVGRIGVRPPHALFDERTVLHFLVRFTAGHFTVESIVGHFSVESTVGHFAVGIFLVKESGWVGDRECSKKPNRDRSMFWSGR